MIGGLVIAFLAAVVGLLALIVWLPTHLLDTHSLVDARGRPDIAARLKAENDLRATLTAVLAGLAVLGGSVVAALNLRHNRRVLEETKRQDRKGLELARRGQVTERFTKAIDQLGNREQLDVRVGGIYALEQIARDAPELHWPIVEILSAFIREHSKPEADTDSSADPRERDGSNATRIGVAADIQAVLTVLGRRNSSMDKGLLDLFHANFADANLRGANLRAAGLRGADLRNAALRGADLQGANLRQADLRGASLRDADLENATLVESNLQGADLRKTNLKGAAFQAADRQPAQGLTWQQLSHALNVQDAKLPTYLDDATAESPGPVHLEPHNG